MDLDRIVDDYLRRLDAAAVVLPPERRADLVADIREHIDAALREHGGGEIDARNVLERLGSPDEIVAAAVDRDRDLPTPDTPPSRVLAIIALVVLAVGGFVLPILGWVIGVVLVLVAKAWTAREKLVGLLAPLAVVLLLVLALVLLLPGSIMSIGAIEGLVLLSVFGGGPAGLAGAIYLAMRLRNTRA